MLLQHLPKGYALVGDVTANDSGIKLLWLEPCQLRAVSVRYFYFLVKSWTKE